MHLRWRSRGKLHPAKLVKQPNTHGTDINLRHFFTQIPISRRIVMIAMPRLTKGKNGEEWHVEQVTVIARETSGLGLGAKAMTKGIDRPDAV